jgi:hypothetical protein
MAGRLLIAVGQATGSAGELPGGVRALIDSADAILVIAPRLPGRLDWIASDTDRATAQADERLAVVLGQLEEAGHQAGGRIGADDPMLAFDDAVREFRPDHVLIALRRAGRAGWQEQGLLEQLLERYGLPVTAFAVGE